MSRILKDQSDSRRSQNRNYHWKYNSMHLYNLILSTRIRSCGALKAESSCGGLKAESSCGSLKAESSCGGLKAESSCGGLKAESSCGANPRSLAS